MQSLRILAFVLAIGWSSTAVLAVVPVPALHRQVTDLTGTLSAQQVGQLEQQLAAFEARKGSQIAVLLVPTTQPEAIEQYSIRVVDQWKLGRKGVDDGALLLVAKDDRTLRIEVGRGLEGAMPDAIAKRIISEVMTPSFRNGDFSGGIFAGVQRMIGVIDGESLPAPASDPRAAKNVKRVLFNLLPYGFLTIFVLGAFLRVALGRLPAATVCGLIVAAVLWLASVAIVLIVVGALVVFFLLLITGGSPGTGRSYGPSGGWSSGGGGGFGGGGFSGGGGGFSGGGASGHW